PGPRRFRRVTCADGRRAARGHDARRERPRLGAFAARARARRAGAVNARPLGAFAGRVRARRAVAADAQRDRCVVAPERRRRSSPIVAATAAQQPRPAAAAMVRLRPRRLRTTTPPSPQARAAVYRGFWLVAATAPA